MEYAFQTIAQDNPMGFPLPASPAYSTWEVYKAACWHRLIDIGGKSFSIVPCSEDECCRTIFAVSRNISIDSTVTVLIGTSSNVDTCADPDCSFICGDPYFKQGKSSGNSAVVMLAQGVQSSGAVPNPAGAEATIPFHLPTAMHVTVVVYDATGTQVATLLDKDCGAGDHQTTFIPNSLPNGTYIYKITGDGSTAIGKIILAR
jgi:hypothetical protein